MICDENFKRNSHVSPAPKPFGPSLDLASISYSPTNHLEAKGFSETCFSVGRESVLPLCKAEVWENGPRGPPKLTRWLQAFHSKKETEENLGRPSTTFPSCGFGFSNHNHHLPLDGEAL